MEINIKVLFLLKFTALGPAGPCGTHAPRRVTEERWPADDTATIRLHCTEDLLVSDPASTRITRLNIQSLCYISPLPQPDVRYLLFVAGFFKSAC